MRIYSILIIYQDIFHSFTNRKMTTPEDFYSKVMQTLKFLNSRLPKGSHVILYGLANGNFLWDHLHNRYHPLGIILKMLLLFNNVNIEFKIEKVQII